MFRKLIGIGIACFSVILLTLTVEEYQLSQVPLPKPAPLQVWLPEFAEIRLESEVHPGTFYIRLSVAEFRDRFPIGGIVTFPPYPLSTGVEIWKPGEGGLFYKTTQAINRPPSWPQYVIVWKVKLEGVELVAYPSSGRWGGPAFGIAATLGVAFLSVAVFRRWV
jgi:hypothetical protein